LWRYYKVYAYLAQRTYPLVRFVNCSAETIPEPCSYTVLLLEPRGGMVPPILFVIRINCSGEVKFGKGLTAAISHAMYREDG